MNLIEIQQHLAKRLRTQFEQVYERPPPGSPEMPCAVIGFPTVVSFHVDQAHQLALLEIEVTLIVGRGDANDAYDRLAKLISTDPEDSSVVRAIEDRRRYPDPPWSRIKCSSTSEPRDEGDGIALNLTLELHA